MEGYYLVVDGIKSYFSINSEVYIFFLKKFVSKNSITIISRKKFLLFLEQDIDSILSSFNFEENNLNSSRIKHIEFKNNSTRLNLKNFKELLAFNLINIYNNVLQSHETEIHLIYKLDDSLC